MYPILKKTSIFQHRFFPSLSHVQNKAQASVLTMLPLQPVQLELVGLVLRLLLEPAGAARVLVLLLAGGGARRHRQLRHRRHAVDLLVQVVQLRADVEQLLGVGGDVIAVTTTGLAWKGGMLFF